MENDHLFFKLKQGCLSILIHVQKDIVNNSEDTKNFIRSLKILSQTLQENSDILGKYMDYIELPVIILLEKLFKKNPSCDEIPTIVLEETLVILEQIIIHRVTLIPIDSMKKYLHILRKLFENYLLLDPGSTTLNPTTTVSLDELKIKILQVFHQLYFTIQKINSSCSVYKDPTSFPNILDIIDQNKNLNAFFMSQLLDICRQETLKNKVMKILSLKSILLMIRYFSVRDYDYLFDIFPGLSGTLCHLIAISVTDVKQKAEVVSLSIDVLSFAVGVVCNDQNIAKKYQNIGQLQEPLSRSSGTIDISNELHSALDQLLSIKFSQSSSNNNSTLTSSPSSEAKGVTSNENLMYDEKFLKLQENMEKYLKVILSPKVYLSISSIDCRYSLLKFTVNMLDHCGKTLEASTPLMLELLMLSNPATDYSYAEITNRSMSLVVELETNEQNDSEGIIQSLEHLAYSSLLKYKNFFHRQFFGSSKQNHYLNKKGKNTISILFERFQKVLIDIPKDVNDERKLYADLLLLKSYLLVFSDTLSEILLIDPTILNLFSTDMHLCLSMQLDHRIIETRIPLQQRDDSLKKSFVFPLKHYRYLSKECLLEAQMVFQTIGKFGSLASVKAILKFFRDSLFHSEDANHDNNESDDNNELSMTPTSFSDRFSMILSVDINIKSSSLQYDTFSISNKNHHRLYKTFLFINNIISGFLNSQIIIVNKNNESMKLMDSFLQLYLSDDFWNYPYDSTNLESCQNYVQISSVLLEGLCVFSSFYAQRNPEKFLINTLYAVLEKLGDPFGVVSQTALTVLQIFSVNLYYHSDVAELILKNSDYVIDQICLRMKNLTRYPTTPFVLKSLFEFSEQFGSLKKVTENGDKQQNQKTIIGSFEELSFSLVMLIGDTIDSIFETLNVLYTNQTYLNAFLDILQSILIILKKRKDLIQNRPATFVEDEKVNTANEILIEEVHNSEDLNEEKHQGGEKHLNVNVTTKILDKLQHFIGMRSVNLKIIELLELCFSMHMNEKDTPSWIHKIWPSLLISFHPYNTNKSFGNDDEILLTPNVCQVQIKTLQFLDTLMEAHDEYMYSKLVIELFPCLQRFIQYHGKDFIALKESLRTSSSVIVSTDQEKMMKSIAFEKNKISGEEEVMDYDNSFGFHSSTPKYHLHLEILRFISRLIQLKSVSKRLSLNKSSSISTFDLCILLEPYLDHRQPRPFQKEAMCVFQSLIALDLDPVWLVLMRWKAHQDGDKPLILMKDGFPTVSFSPLKPPSSSKKLNRKNKKTIDRLQRSASVLMMTLETQSNCQLLLLKCSTLLSDNIK